MISRRGRADRFAQEIEAAEKRIAVELEAAQGFAAAAERATVELDELAALEGAGSITGEAAEKRLAEIQAGASRARALADQRRRVAAKLAEQLELLRAAAAQAAFDDASSEALAALEAQAAASEKVGRLLGQLVVAVAALETARSDAGEALARAAELRPDNDAELPALDEPEWPEGRAELVQVIEAGPDRPVADRETTAAAFARQQDDSADAVVRQALRDALVVGSFLKLELLPDHLRERATASVDEFACVLIDEAKTERAREKIRDRVERVKALTVVEV